MASLTKKWRQWWWAQRTSARTAYLFQVVSRISSGSFSLIWQRLLAEAMGLPLTGLFLFLQGIFSLGGVGDFGIGGGVAIRVGEELGASRDDERELQKFLACARSIFLSIALLLLGGMLLLSPVLASWLHLPATANAGPMMPVFVIGGVLMTGMLLFSYMGSINYACGNVAWPVLPELLLLHLSLFGHWELAQHHQPLWIQYLPYVASAMVRLYLSWLYVKISYPSLSRLWPIRFNRTIAVVLFENSFWFYLSATATLLYRNTDGWVIGLGFSPETLAIYTYNYKFCELAVFVAVTASFVSLPRITQWMASPKPEDQERVRSEMRRLNQFQALFGCGAALAYLAGINLFMKVWWYRSHTIVPPAELLLQMAFALNMAVTTSSDAGVQLAFRSGKSGRRIVGSVLGLGGLLNLGLSILAMRQQSLVGIALATVLAQSLVSLVASFYICRHLKLTWLPWILKGWLCPLLGILLAVWLKSQFPPESVLNFSILAVAYLGMLALAAWGLGINLKAIAAENRLFKKFFRH